MKYFAPLLAVGLVACSQVAGPIEITLEDPFGLNGQTVTSPVVPGLELATQVESTATQSTPSFKDPAELASVPVPSKISACQDLKFTRLDTATPPAAVVASMSVKGSFKLVDGKGSAVLPFEIPLFSTAAPNAAHKVCVTATDTPALFALLKNGQDNTLEVSATANVGSYVKDTVIKLEVSNSKVAITP